MLGEYGVGLGSRGNGGGVLRDFAGWYHGADTNLIMFGLLALGLGTAYVLFFKL